MKYKFLDWDKHLNDDGLLQLIYYYNSNCDQLNNILGTPEMRSAALNKPLYLKTFSGTYNSQKEDGVLIYKKSI